MVQFQSRSAARARLLAERGDGNAKALAASARLFRQLQAGEGLSAVEAVRKVLAEEPQLLRQCASYRVLAKLAPLLSALALVERGL
ncbi:MAG: hypothetical protein ACRCYV_04225 [Aeromonas sp.]